MKIDLNNVASVYSGKQGKCCCGCAGKHTYHSMHRNLAPNYVRDDDDDFSPAKDRVVRILVKKIEQAAQEGRVEYVRADFVSAVNEENTRVWIAYFAKPDEAFADEYKHLDADEKKARAKANEQLQEIATAVAWERAAQTMC